MIGRTRIGLVYHSEGGHVASLASCIAEGARAVAGAEVEVYSVDEIEPRSLADFDAIILGCPTRFGTISAAMKAFMERTLDAWEARTLQDRIGASFSVSGGVCGDKVLALAAINHFFFMHGMIVIGNPMSSLNTDLFIGAGAKTQQLAKHGALFSTEDAERSRALGRRVAILAARLRGPS